jgi:hypothetical protein
VRKSTYFDGCPPPTAPVMKSTFSFAKSAGWRLNNRKSSPDSFAEYRKRDPSSDFPLSRLDAHVYVGNPH